MSDSEVKIESPSGSDDEGAPIDLPNVKPASIDIREHRSGVSYIRPPTVFLDNPSTNQTVSMATAAPTATTPSVSTANMSTLAPMPTQAAIKILPTRASVAPFTGEDDNYPAQKFIERCEDIMKGADCVLPGDKISFIRSNLELGSLASQSMDASAFTEPHACQDYDTFRANFLETFGGYSKRQFVNPRMVTWGDFLPSEFGDYAIHPQGMVGMGWLSQYLHGLV